MYYIAYFYIKISFPLIRKIYGIRPQIRAIFFIAYARNGHISTSRVKSDVTIELLDPDFRNDAKMSAIRVHLRQM